MRIHLKSFISWDACKVELTVSFPVLYIHRVYNMPQPPPPIWAPSGSPFVCNSGDMVVHRCAGEGGRDNWVILNIFEGRSQGSPPLARLYSIIRIYRYIWLSLPYNINTNNGWTLSSIEIIVKGMFIIDSWLVFIHLSIASSPQSIRLYDPYISPCIILFLSVCPWKNEEEKFTKYSAPAVF